MTQQNPDRHKGPANEAGDIAPRRPKKRRPFKVRFTHRATRANGTESVIQWHASYATEKARDAAIHNAMSKNERGAWFRVTAEAVEK